MKKNLVSFFALAVFWTACENKPKPQMPIDQSTEVSAVELPEGWLGSYMQLKDALVTEENETAVAAAKQFLEKIQQIDTKGLEAEASKAVQDLIPGINYDLNQIITLETKEQRIVFKALSEKAVQLMGLMGTTTTVYKQFCPMYAGGAAWLSLQEEIRNPFYGDKMLTCGVIQETFTP